MAGFLESLSPAARHALGLVFGTAMVVVVFVLLPGAAAELNDSLDWPRWRLPAGRFLGAGVFLLGLALVIHCSRLFARLGKGTPVPIDPPTQLVVAGIYRFSRNPIYVGQVSILLSYFLYSGELALLLYAGLWALFVHVFVVRVEEPSLRRRFGPAYDDYLRDVPRWFGPSARR